MNEQKIAGLISICRKAGYLVLGGDNLKGYTHKVYLVLLDSQAGKNTKKIATKLQVDTNANLYELDNLASITNISNCKLVAIKNKGLSDKIEQLLKE